MKKRVLIVDDEIDTLRLLKTIVEISGYEVYTTLNSLEALTLAQVEQPDVVLLDIMMPKLDGFQLCKMMRAHPVTRELPIIFVTAYSALDLEDRRVSSGGDMIIPKPINMPALIEAIESVQQMERNIPADLKPEGNGHGGDNKPADSAAPAPKAEAKADSAIVPAPPSALTASAADKDKPTDTPSKPA